MNYAGMIRKSVFPLLLTGALAAAPMAAASATGSSPGTATITGGALSLIVPNSLVFSGQILGQDQYLDSTSGQTMQVTDATGSNSGWNVSAYVNSALTNGTYSLPATSLTINGVANSSTSTTAPTSACATGSTCTLATAPNESYPVSIPVGSSSGGVVYDAASSTGEGTENISNLNWWLRVPGNTHAGTYTGTLTVSVNSGPNGANIYPSAVKADSPQFYYRLNDQNTSTAPDYSGSVGAGTYSSTVGQGVVGPDSGSGAIQANSSPATLVSIPSFTNATNTSNEANGNNSYVVWFKSSGTAGGQIIQHTGSYNYVNRSSYGPFNGSEGLSLNSSGQVVATASAAAGASNGGTSGSVSLVATSPNSYNNGQWHQAVLVISNVYHSSNGQNQGEVTLYVDGQQVAQTLAASLQNAGYYNAMGFPGPAEIGATTSGGSVFAGSISEASEFTNITLTASQVANLYAAG